MSKKFSWNWLAPRTAAEQLRSAAQQPGQRAPLAAIEPLDDRIMLSVAPIASEGQPTSAGILIGLLKAQFGDGSVAKENIGLIGRELNILKLAALDGVKLDVANKITEILGKIEDVLYTTAFIEIKGDIKGESQDDKHADQVAALQTQFDKLDEILNTIGGAAGEDPLLPAVQGLEKKAMGTLIGLLDQGPASDPGMPGLGNNIFLKITDGFNDITDGLIKLQNDVIFAESKQDENQKYQDYLKYLDFLKLNKMDQQIKDSKLSAPLQEQLHNFILAAGDVADMIVAPVDTPSDGLILLDNTGDIIA